MTENIQLNKKTLVILFLGVLLTAFLGVMAGSYFMQMRAEKPHKAGEKLKLKVGQIFPDYNFNSLAGERNQLYQLLDGKKAVLLFISTDCGACGPETQKWSVSYPQTSSQYAVLGIASEIPGAIKEYQTSHNLSFPLFYDSLGKFTDEYKIDAYPTLIGLNEKKEIVFIEFGHKKDKTVEDFLNRL